MPGPAAPRYYGLASQYGDIYAFVRAHAALLDATTEPLPDPRSGTSNERYNHTFVGGTLAKLGSRFRFPYPYTSAGYSPPHAQIGGGLFEVWELASCEGLCDLDPLCKGVYKDRSRCFTLHELVETDTGLAGDSYTRNMTAPPCQPVALAASSELEVRVKVRVAANRTVGSIHIVDWRNALPAVWGSGGVLPKGSYPPVTVNVSNAILAPPVAPESDATQTPREVAVAADCGKLEFVLHQLGGAQTAQVLKGVCAGEVTVLTVPSPVPWSIVEIRPKASIRV